MEAAQQIEIGGERYLQNRKKLMKPLKDVSPHLYRYADYWAPDIEPHTEERPVITMDLIKADVADYVKQQIGSRIPKIQTQKNRKQRKFKSVRRRTIKS